VATPDTWQLAFNADGNSLVVVDRKQGRALVINQGVETQVQLRPHPQIARTAISPNGRWVATSTYWGRQSTIKVWNAVTGQLVSDLPGMSLNGDARVAFSPDGRWLVLGTAREYRCYEVGSWEPGRTYTRDREDTSAAVLAFAPDSKILAILQNLRLVRLIDVATGKELGSLASPDPRGISYLAFSPDGSRLAAACGNGVIQAWDLRSLRQHLAGLGLDWDLPPYPPVDRKREAVPLQIKVDIGNLSPTPKPPAQGERDKLLQEVEKRSQAIARNPNDVEAYYQRGRLHIRLRDFAKARADLDRAIALKPDHFEAYHHRGHAHEGLGQAEKAIEDFSAALKGEPQNAHLYQVRGRNYLQLQDHARAVEDLNRALELKLSNKVEEAAACNNLAWIHVAGPAKFRAPDRALSLAKRAGELVPDSPAYCHTLGVAHFRLGQYREAVAALERSVKNNRGQATAFDLYFLAMCQQHLGNTERARDCYDRGIAWQKKARLTSQHATELNAFRAEVETLMKESNPRDTQR
jgi:tetratricopeptide (TPR) repeat protein